MCQSRSDRAATRECNAITLIQGRANALRLSRKPAAYIVAMR
jgi:hypothetical protein